MAVRRIGFFGIAGHSRYPYGGAMPHIDGIPSGARTGLEGVLDRYDETDNKGNMIHGEAPARILQFDRHNSAYVSARELVEIEGWDAGRISEALNARFDLVVYSTANAIRPNFDPGCTAQVLDGLRIDFAVLGMGMQNRLPPSTESLHPQLVELLEVCNRKARIFGVRGRETEAWLASVGYGRAKALGCPSMYVYPRNVLDIAAPDPARVRTAITGGYIHGRVPRSTALVNLFDGFEAHYVMQEEIPILRQRDLLPDVEDLYDEATGTLRKDALEHALEQVHRRSMPFASYRWFQEPAAWRAFASRFDVYLGDRLHGGLVAMQSGVPAILMAEDRRVIEIADFYSIPRISAHDARGAGVREIVGERLTSVSLGTMKEAYLARFRAFEAEFAELGVPLAVPGHSLRADGAAEGWSRPPLPRPGPLRRIKDWVADVIR